MDDAAWREKMPRAAGQGCAITSLNNPSGRMPIYRQGNDQLNHLVMQKLLSRWNRHGYLFAVGAVVIATAVFALGRDYFATGQWALLYLLLIMLIAFLQGVNAALVAAVLAFFAWDFFFLPPYNTLYVADPKDWLSLAVFLIVGVVVGVLAGRMREHAAEAEARNRELTLLNRIGANLVSVTSTRTLAEILRNETIAVTGAREVTLLLMETTGQLTPVTGSSRHETVDDDVLLLAAWVCRQSKALGLPPIPPASRLGVEGWPISASPTDALPASPGGDSYLPLQTALRVEGVLYVGARADGKPFTPDDARLLVSLTNLVASFLERRRLETTASRADALREADRLKSTLISSVSHQLKTPLAAVTAAVTSLVEGDLEWDGVAVRHELEAVNRDLTRLNESISALLDLSRLKADAWVQRLEWYELGEILSDALHALSEAQRERLVFAIPEELPLVRVDFQQWARALQHLLENALAYSTTPVRVGATETAREVQMWVEDTGPGIADVERERIFEQFYRGAAAGAAPAGTGLGLTITAEIVRYHGGRIWVEDVQPHGARFVIALPKEESRRDG